MMKEIGLLLVLSFFTGIDPAFANQRLFPYRLDGVETVTGIVQSTSRNIIEVYDEMNKRKVRFIYLGRVGEFQRGDYVRINYRLRDGVVQTIKRMTVLKYNKDGQNLGNIIHQ